MRIEECLEKIFNACTEHDERMQEDNRKEDFEYSCERAFEIVSSELEKREKLINLLIDDILNVTKTKEELLKGYKELLKDL